MRKKKIYIYSIFKSLALPAVKKQLLHKGYSAAEVKAVIEALEIVRDGTRVQWREETIQQVKGCSLGPADSCDYSDIALDSFLDFSSYIGAQSGHRSQVPQILP